MDITAMKRNIPEHTYRQATARHEASGPVFSQAVQEAESRLQQKNTEVDPDIQEEDLWQAIADRKEEIREKLRNGDTEVKFQIGACSYTEKEWERMMEQFDSLEEIIKYMMSERMKKQRQQAYWQVLGKPEQEEKQEQEPEA